MVRPVCRLISLAAEWRADCEVQTRASGVVVQVAQILAEGASYVKDGPRAAGIIEWRAFRTLWLEMVVGQGGEKLHDVPWDGVREGAAGGAEGDLRSGLLSLCQDTPDRVLFFSCCLMFFPIIIEKLENILKICVSTKKRYKPSYPLVINFHLSSILPRTICGRRLDIYTCISVHLIHSKVPSNY